MKRAMYIALAMVLTLALVAVSVAGSRGKMDLKAGDEIYACDCGEKCPCLGMSKNPGKCTCGKEMVKAKVTKAEGDDLMLKAGTWDKERPFKASGKYACACPPECKCDTISQNPGKCTCGVEMKKM
ncbi:MAG: hypothetical protein ACM3ON_00495 [Chloroflexota bacterium]